MTTQQEIISDFQVAFDFHSKGDLDRAEVLYKKILKKKLVHYDTLRHLGILYQDRQMFELAEKYYMKAYKANSNHFSIYNNLGTIKFLQFKMEDALNFYKQGFKLNPRFVPVINNISAYYHRQFRDEECMKFAKLALSIEPNNLNSKVNYAKALAISNEPHKSIEIFNEILKIQTDANNYKNLGTAYRNIGELEKSCECFEKALIHDNNDTGAFFNLSASKFHKPNKDLLIEFEKTLRLSKNLVYSDKAAIAFGIYNSYKKLKDYKKASKFLLLGNKFLDNWIKTDINEEENFFNEIKRIYTSDFIQKNSLAIDKKNTNLPEPIFILGMPRSGTTLCEQILSSHSKIFGGGELQHFIDISEIGNTVNISNQLINDYKDKLNKMSPEIFKSKSIDYLEKLKKLSSKHQYVTDKMPHNFVLIGFIKILFPKAKIIYCKRDKIDNCFSLFAHKFMDKSHGYCYNQKTLGKYYNLHLDLMDHWLNIFKNEIYILNHENLIEDQEKYSKELIDYCGLEWEIACLEFYKTKREVQTASNEQVREPINKKSIAAWKKYEEFLGPLIKTLN
ncbi:sulfotransferase [Pelagibacterales bacterium]|nr:sulfotransferase [Pelagibacterales bacterium]